MGVILEGFDNSGKSTLADNLGKDAGATVYYPGPKPVGISEIRQQLRQQAQWASEPSAVLDRTTLFSQQAYALGNLKGMAEFACGALMEIGTIAKTVQNSLVVYCRPPIEKILDFSTHKVKVYDDVKKIKWLEENAEAIIRRYDQMFSHWPHELWDYTNPNAELYQKLIWRLS